MCWGLRTSSTNPGLATLRYPIVLRASHLVSKLEGGVDASSSWRRITSLRRGARNGLYGYSSRVSSWRWVARGSRRMWMSDGAVVEESVVGDRRPWRPQDPRCRDFVEIQHRSCSSCARRFHSHLAHCCSTDREGKGSTQCRKTSRFTATTARIK